MSMYKLYAVIQKPRGELLLQQLKEQGFNSTDNRMMYVGGGYAEILINVDERELSLLKLAHDTTNWHIEEI